MRLLTPLAWKGSGVGIRTRDRTLLFLRLLPRTDCILFLAPLLDAPLQIGERPNPELRVITSSFGQVSYRGQSAPIRHLSVRALLPDTEHYMTYEGSTTHPGCWETTVWILINKPIYITRQEVSPHLTLYEKK